jgi:hypothetical protein
MPIDPTHLQELEQEQQHLKEVEIFLLDRLTEVTARLGSITREIQAGQQ